MKKTKLVCTLLLLSSIGVTASEERNTSLFDWINSIISRPKSRIPTLTRSIPGEGPIQQGPQTVPHTYLHLDRQKNERTAYLKIEATEDNTKFSEYYPEMDRNRYIAWGALGGFALASTMWAIKAYYTSPGTPAS